VSALWATNPFPDRKDIPLDTPEPPVFSKQDVDEFTPAGSPRTYVLAPLTVRERNAARTDVVAEAGLYPPQAQLYAAMRAAVQEAEPANLDELLLILDEAEANPEDLALVARVGPVESACMGASAYRALLAQRTRYMDAVPFVYFRHAVRDWRGPQLPAFRRERGVLPLDLLDLVPEDEMRAAGFRAFSLSQPTMAAAGNSGAPSPSSATRKDTRARSSRSAGGAISSRAKKSKAIPA
jgi:hypothetical protein